MNTVEAAAPAPPDSDLKSVAHLKEACGRIKSELVIDLPTPRHYTVKTTPRFSELKARVTEDIRAESLKAARMEL